MRDGFQTVIKKQLRHHEKETEAVDAVDERLEQPGPPSAMWSVQQRVNGTALERVRIMKR